MYFGFQLVKLGLQMCILYTTIFAAKALTIVICDSVGWQSSF